MEPTVKNSGHPFLRSGITVGLAMSLMGFPATCTGPNQSLFGSMNDQELAVHEESGQANPVSKPKTWTVYCEREDGATSKFTVSAELSDQLEALQNSAEEKSRQKSKPDLPANEGQEVVLDRTAQNLDPFEESKLKCGKLLTLLAIFATVHKQTQ